MIIFVAPFPLVANEKDGLVQRVASIDSLVKNYPRVYLDISFRRFWFKRQYLFGKATVLQLNAILHFFTIISFIKKGTLVYIHSIYNSLKVLPAYWLTKPITDLHGVVPEEMLFEGKLWHSRLYSLIEHVALRRSASVLYVTSAMKRHFERKYGRRSASDIVIAILPKPYDKRGSAENVLGVTRDPHAVIYAGGLQNWQNIPTMTKSAVNAPNLRFVFLSGEAEALRQALVSAGVSNFACFAVKPNQVPDHYLSVTYGFILRDPVLLNQVACPTKLVEYLYWGVIPIVITPGIGDFLEMGYEFISLEDFNNGRLPNDSEANRMRITNRQVVEKLIVSSDDELGSLRKKLLNNLP